MDHFLDIFFLAAIAAFILYRLFKVLGQDVGLKPTQAEPAYPTDQPTTEPVGTSHTTSDLSHAIKDYGQYDASFNLSSFIEGAKGAFEMILRAFNEGDKETLDHLLDGDLRKRFETELNDLEKKQEETDNSLIRIKSCELLDLKVERKKTAYARVRYISDQILVTYNSQGHVVEGDPDQIETLTEIWTFKRNINTDDPNWLLVETESLD